MTVASAGTTLSRVPAAATVGVTVVPMSGRPSAAIVGEFGRLEVEGCDGRSVQGDSDWFEVARVGVVELRAVAAVRIHVQQVGEEVVLDDRGRPRFGQGQELGGGPDGGADLLHGFAP
jgi:hypothetical protein